MNCWRPENKRIFSHRSSCGKVVSIRCSEPTMASGILQNRSRGRHKSRRHSGNRVAFLHFFEHCLRQAKWYTIALAKQNLPKSGTKWLVSSYCSIYGFSMTHNKEMGNFYIYYYKRSDSPAVYKRCTENQSPELFGRYPQVELPWNPQMELIAKESMRHFGTYWFNME